MSYLSVSTWSLHRLLGPLRWTAWDAEAGSHRTIEQEQPEIITLLDLPAEAASRGYEAIEVCHFHFPSTDSAYLKQLRSAFEVSGVSFDTLLLDYGNLTAPDERQRKADFAFICDWIDIASQCGAKQIRVIAGEAPPTDEEAISLSAASLIDLAHFASPKGVRIITENFKPLTSTAESCHKLLAQTGNQVGFITDFGNFHGAEKVKEIASTLPFSVSVHAKATYDEAGFPDEAEYLTYLNRVHAAGYNGAYVLIYDGPGDMWEGLERIKAIVKPFLLPVR
ncbi:sugar phosphate isomerase/epimerase [Paenibacillus prosopidis]|uniref:Sugar phosphate isomerase/epimerase n=1 Tax=Paenibacillus prosopidis TaxID=630520 RepID=A0A368W4Z3_9BACL|nr:sugar phosphate isomerase/epimerase family protein [Paenibacillus prosopidis]RCW50825.1 sugar phosphate isomerase/epimerase [Paenibacillus prosopidis]